MRGVVSLAAALALPLDMPQRDLILALAVAVILGTLGAQGLTLPWLIRRLGIEPPDPRRRRSNAPTRRARRRGGARPPRRARGRHHVARERAGRPAPGRRRTCARHLGVRRRRSRSADGGVPAGAGRDDGGGAHRAAAVRDDGEIDDEIVRALQRELDLEEALLAAFEDSDTADVDDPGPAPTRMARRRKG